MSEGELIFAALAACLGVFILWRSQRRRKRRASLRKEPDGQGGYVYTWIEFDGSTRQSKKNPDEPGGEWHPAGDSTGGGTHGDGGDSGGGGD